MKTATDYTGYEIVWGFLDGNLGELEQYADEYAAACEDALAEAFPGAEIETRRQRNASGCTPSTLKTAVYPPTGINLANPNCYEDHSAAERVDRICADVWERSEEWAK